jgi:4-hydroxy-tetrahydrodipicolinate synthase
MRLLQGGSVLSVQFGGSMVALVTPFRDGKVDEVGLGRLVDWHLAGRTDGIVPCGTTGETSTLSADERERVTAKVVARVKGRIPVLAGGPGNDTAASCDAARRAKVAGANGILAITPYYNKPSQEGHYRHLAAIAEVGLPVVAYNVPSRTGTDLLPETVERLHRDRVIVGIKEATGSMVRLLEIRERCGDDLILLSGDDFTVAPFVACGGHGVISVSANIVPQRMHDLVAAAREGRVAEATREQLHLQALHRALFVEPSPAPTKAALELMGLIAGDLRLPMTPPSPALVANLRQILAQLGAFA